jgi:hypothetical protein
MTVPITIYARQSLVNSPFGAKLFNPAEDSNAAEAPPSQDDVWDTK